MNTGRRSWTGDKDRGSRGATPQQKIAVVRYLREECTGIDRAKPIALIAKRLKMSGRKLRDVLAEIDGRDLVIAQGDGLMWVAVSAPETLSLTRSLRSRIKELRARADRRDEMAARMPGGALI